MSKQPLVQTGLEVLVSENCRLLRGARVGLLANQASVNSRLEHALDLIVTSQSCRLSCLFAPEHGFRGELQDMASVKDVHDKKTGLPIISLYGKTPESLYPSAEQLKELDILLVDLPDIGTRYYTFAQTLGFAMKSASSSGTKVVVLDRPNPINGVEIEGANLLTACRSFCGFAPVANRHGLTLGELSLLMNKGFGTGENRIDGAKCELEVVKLRGWKRTMYFDETGLPWVIPSPNMPTLDTAIVYPGTCLFEASKCSEGRGTTKPFEQIGAPYIDSFHWKEEVMGLPLELKGALLRPLCFEPQFQKFRGEKCHGLQIHITERSLFKPLRWAAALLYSLKELYPKEFEWRTDEYEFVKDPPAVDLLFGSDLLRKTIDTAGDLNDLFSHMDQFERWFTQARSEFLLY